MSSIRDIPITAKCMILNGWARNFKSILTEQRVDFTEHKDLLVVAKTGNGSGKSTIHKELLYYGMTGESSQKKEVVDDLINTVAKNKMLVGVQWFFCGEYYQLERGRSPQVFDIKRLNDKDEWVELENLPAKAAERQAYLYSLMGLSKAYARTLINSTVLLGGDTFTSFLNLSLADRRDVLDPVFDTLICTSMSKELKLNQKGIVVEQAQTLREITSVSTEVALAEQSLVHSKQDKNTLQSAYIESSATLTEKVSDCSCILEQVSSVATDGLELKEVFSAKVSVFSEDKVTLDNRLSKDIKSLGEFKIDTNDVVLVKLGNDIKSVGKEIQLASAKVEEKKIKLVGEVETVISETKKVMQAEEEQYLVEEEALSSMKSIEEGEAALKILREGLVLNENLEVKAENNLEEVSQGLEAKEDELLKANNLSIKYQTNVDKLTDVERSFVAKINLEQENVDNLISAGNCPSCKQSITEEWVESCKESILDKIGGLEKERAVYAERASKGMEKIVELEIPILTNEVYSIKSCRVKAEQTLREVLAQVLQFKNDITISVNEVDKLVMGRKAALGSLESNHLQSKQANQTIIDRAEGKATKALGEDLANLKALKASAPSRTSNLVQQVKDREKSLEGEFGGLKTHLQKVYELAINNIDNQVEGLKSQLDKDLQKLVSDKENEVNRGKEALESKEIELRVLSKNFNAAMNLSEASLMSKYKDHNQKKGQLTSLQDKHDDQQIEIEAIGQAILLCSEKEGKADVVRKNIPDFNRSVNKYLHKLNLMIAVEFDEEFNIEMTEVDEGGAPSLYSLSMGQRARLDIAIRLALRDVAISKQSINMNILCLDETLENLCEQGTLEAVSLLKEEFQDMNLTVISQKNSFIRELFDDVKTYALVNKVTTLVENEN